MKNNAAERKKRDKGTWCKVCGITLRTNKEQRRRMCNKHHKLEKKRWRSVDKSKTRWRGNPR